MTRLMFKITAVAYWLGLIFWIGAIIAVAIAAMNTFGTLPDESLGVTLESYDSYPAEHHGRLAAGMVMEKNFFAADLIQMVAIPVVIIALLAQVFLFDMPIRRPANLLRTICLVGAAGLFASYAFNLAPRMNGELRAYWAAAQAGDLERADAHRTSFDADHPRAEMILQINLLLALVGAAASAAAFTDRPSPAPASQLEEPRLSRSP